MTAETKVRQEYRVVVPITIKVWAYDEADALRQASQSVSTGFPLVTKVQHKEADNTPSRV